VLDCELDKPDAINWISAAGGKEPAGKPCYGEMAGHHQQARDNRHD